MAQSRWFWFLVALVVVLAACALPVYGALVLAPLAALLIGALAARSVLGHEGTAGQATAVGAIVGVGALIAAIVAFGALGYVLGSTPGIQEFVRASEPHPEARVPYDWMAPLAAATGALAGFGVGLVYLVIAAAGGFIAGLLGGRTHLRAAIG